MMKKFYVKLNVIFLNMTLKENLFELNVLNEIKCYILITLMYIPNTWNEHHFINLMGHEARHFFEAGSY
jgi:hypothetical protein